jgi:uncharacterized protein
MHIRPRLIRLAAMLSAAFLLLAAPADAACTGINLIDAMPQADSARLRAAADQAPFARGNLWRATKGASTITLLGTYHFGDARHDATLTRVTPMIAAAKTLLVEAGPDEQAALQDRLATDPSAMIITTGPTLRESLTDAEWALLAEAMRARGIPPFMASKFRPWYISGLLSVPACDMARMATAGADGLDARVIAQAQAAGVPVRALEPFDTLFAIFEKLTSDEQLSMIRAALATEAQADDLAVTLADSYFAEENRLIWELTRQQALAIPGATPEQVNSDFASMERALMTDRNRAWIPVLTTAATQGPVFTAFGALHLSGDTGVLALLEQEGFVIERLGM